MYNIFIASVILEEISEHGNSARDTLITVALTLIAEELKSQLTSYKCIMYVM